MLRLALVGDCSQQDPALLARALDAAMGAADLVLQLGDIHGSGDDRTSYDLLMQRVVTGRVHPVPGNHDAEGGRWDAFMADPKDPHRGRLAKQWFIVRDDAILVGLDNSCDQIDATAWDILNHVGAELGTKSRPVFLAVHKALSPLVLMDGTESTHIMAEGGPCPDREKLAAWVQRHDATVCCGHYHGSAVMQTPYGPVLLEGRGGAAGAGNVGYTLVLVQPEGWTAHPVTL